MLQCTRRPVHFTHQLRCGQASRRARPPRLKFFSHAITIARMKRRGGRVETASSAMELRACRTREQKPNGKFAPRRRDASSNGAGIDPSRRAHCRSNITRAADRIGACWQRGCGVDHASGMAMVNVIVRGGRDRGSIAMPRWHAPAGVSTVPGLAVFLVGVLQRRVCGSVCVGPCWIASGRLGAARRGVTQRFVAQISLRIGIARRAVAAGLHRRPRLFP